MFVSSYAQSYTFRPFTEREFTFRYPNPDASVNYLGQYYDWHDLDIEDTITMFSGRELRVSFDTAEDSYSFNDGPYYFVAQHNTNDGVQTVRFLIDTRDRDGFNRPHPDLFAGRLMTRSIAFVEERLTEGQPLKRLAACWLTGNPGEMLPSDNYIQFEEGLKAGLSPEEAAFSTWTGRQALKHGFTEISLIEDDLYGWLVNFDRPA